LDHPHYCAPDRAHSHNVKSIFFRLLLACAHSHNVKSIFSRLLLACIVSIGLSSRLVVAQKSAPLPPVTSSMDEPHVREQHEDPSPLDTLVASNTLAMMIPPRPTQPSANLMNDLREYLSMDDLDQYAAGRLLTAMGFQDRLQEIAIVSPADFRAEFAHCGSTAPKLSLPARSKLLEACKILHKGGKLDELRNIGRSDLVSFVVGDQRFTSSLATLCRVEGSYLECLFSGRHFNAMRRCPDSGDYFIDRSSKYMPYILDYLRYSKVLSLPKDKDEKDMLAAEADFYGLPDLVRALRGPRVWTALFLSDRTQAIQDVEHQQRL
jgi:BTB/POZ domain